jgi:hypothetical protein
MAFNVGQITVYYECMQYFEITACKTCQV